MGDPYARLRAHVARGLEQKGEQENVKPVPRGSNRTRAQRRSLNGRPKPERDDWMKMAYAVVSVMKISPDLREEAVQEAALAGWIAAEKWRSDGGMSRRNWMWLAMERGLIDWLRLRLGRLGNRAAWEESVKHLDEPTAEDLTLGDMLACDNPFAALEITMDLDLLVQRAQLNRQERQWVDVIRADLPQKVLMDDWGVSEGRVSQVKREAVKKLRGAA